MRKIFTESEVGALEKMVDRNTLAAVLDTLAEIAGLKAQHIAENWQDATLARAWERAASRIAKVTLPRVPGIREG